MAKQIKLGFDKVPTRVVEGLSPLYDLSTGIPLTDEAGNNIYTVDANTLSGFNSSDKSSSLHVNSPVGSSVPVAAQFKELSAVSSSLLGIPRSEVQLGLFSDVSVYGLDENIWEYFRFTGVGLQPPEWINRKNQIYGNRHFGKFVEVAEEQALALTSFPVPYTFPFGPKWEEIKIYNPTLFDRYKKFITLGNELYLKYAVQLNKLKFAQENFLPNTVAVATNEDVVYTEDLDFAFAEIEKWTLSWMKLRDGKLLDDNGEKIDFPLGYDATNTSPGYSSNYLDYSQMESRKSFRYQPGRISGFTFGVRASADQGSLENIIEWGCCNDTDEYVFQIRGSQFSIVRRSTVPLPEENLIQMGLTANDQVLKPPLNPLRSSSEKGDLGLLAEPDLLYETVIPRSLFNGDPVDGNGKSGHIISFKEVTMYKIEFGWYGAIGARFYTYAPAGQGEARWILIHQIIIENQVNEPCLKDPYLKFRYTLALTNQSNLTSPQYIYKYGASYYIDGDDQGNVNVRNSSSNIIDIDTLQTKSLIGIKAKDVLYNSDGISIKNKKDIIPTKLTIGSTVAAKIDVIICEGCKGFGYHYTPSLHNGISETSKSSTFRISADRKNLIYDDDVTTFNIDDDGKKIIGDGIYSSYIRVTEENKTSAKIVRRVGNSKINNEINESSDYSRSSVVKLLNGDEQVLSNYTFDGRLSGYSLAVCNIAFYKPKLKVNFLNPVAREFNHFNEFFIGVTNKNPTKDIQSGELLFDNLPTNFDDILYGEFTQYAPGKTSQGVDTSDVEWRYGYTFENDPRTKNPLGLDSGKCSTAEITVNTQTFDVVFRTSVPGNPPGNFLVFTSGSINSISDLKNGEIGIQGLNDFVASGVKFLSSSATPFNENNTIKYYIKIDGDLSETTLIAIRVVNIRGRYINKSKIFNFSIYPIYVVLGLRDYAKVNNITVEESDDVNKFSYTPTWLISDSSNINVINSGRVTERLNPLTGLFEAGGLSFTGNPPTNFISKERLNSAEIDTQLQQPLRPGEVKSTFFIGANESEELDLSHIFGQDRYVITPGQLNQRAYFITGKALDGQGEVQVNIMTKEQ